MKQSILLMFCMLVITVINAQNANTSLSNLVSTTKINANLLPDNSNKRNLGNATKTWNKIYFDSAIYFDSIRFITALGNDNTAIGNNAMFLNRGGTSNTAAGSQSLYSNLYGTKNTSIGYQALYQNINSSNTAVGCRALFGGGDNCTATGFEALFNGNNSAYGNTADGYQSMHSNTSGETNTAVGFNALYGNTTGSNNVAIGNNSLAQAIKVSNIVAVGDNALAWLIDGMHCTAVGSEAGYNSNGNNNTYLGYHAGNTVESGSSNTIIGYGADINDGNLNNATAIGNLAISGASNRVRIGNGSVTSIGGAVGWTNFSDERIKTNIKQDVPGLAFINLLKPVTYNFDLSKEEQIFKRKDSVEWKEKYDIQKVKFTGFLAQQVEAAAKKINYDFSGVDKPANDKDVYGLRYSDFVVPLVKAVQELSKRNDMKDASIDSLKSEIGNLKSEMENLKAMIVGKQSAVNSEQITSIHSASLSQNIPNPFSNSTTINFSLPEKFSSAKIIVTNESGNALKQINLSQEKGSITIDAPTLVNGTYQYSLIVDGKTMVSKQMEILK